MSEHELKVFDADTEVELMELCRVCGVSRELVIEWVAEDVLVPRGEDRWRFSGRQLKRARLAWRLQRDLELHTSALPTVLDLVEEVERLRREVRVLRRLRDSM